MPSPFSPAAPVVAEPAAYRVILIIPVRVVRYAAAVRAAPAAALAVIAHYRSAVVVVAYAAPFACGNVVKFVVRKLAARLVRRKERVRFFRGSLAPVRAQKFLNLAVRARLKVLLHKRFVRFYLVVKFL